MRGTHQINITNKLPSEPGPDEGFDSKEEFADASEAIEESINSFQKSCAVFKEMTKEHGITGPEGVMIEQAVVCHETNRLISPLISILSSMASYGRLSVTYGLENIRISLVGLTEEILGMKIPDKDSRDANKMIDVLMKIDKPVFSKRLNKEITPEGIKRCVYHLKTVFALETQAMQLVACLADHKGKTSDYIHALLQEPANRRIVQSAMMTAESMKSALISTMSDSDYTDLEMECLTRIAAMRADARGH